MNSLEASLHCALCSGGIGPEEWTKEFNAVFLREDELKLNGENMSIHIGKVHCDDSPRFRRLQIVPLQFTINGQPALTNITVYRSPSIFTSANAFLLHSSCLLVMHEYAEVKMRRTIDTTQLFLLCQSLLPEEQRNFGYQEQFNLSDCPDPKGPIVSDSVIETFRNWELVLQPTDINMWVPLLRLPIEVIMMILKVLPPSALVNFFCASKQTLGYADLFCALHPSHFYRCVEGCGIASDDVKLMMLGFGKFCNRLGPLLDRRWEVVSNVICLAKHASHICQSLNGPSLDTRAPLQAAPHMFGFKEISTEVPKDLRSMEIHTKVLRSKRYICGLGLKGKATDVFCGTKSEYFSRFDIRPTQTRQIGFIVDSLGIRSLRFDDAPWGPNEPEEIKCWEGFSIRRQENMRITITQDAIKFRQIRWYDDIQSSFDERILMRPFHASKYGSLSQEDYVQFNPEEEESLVAGFGNFPVEAVYLDKDLRSIIMYCDDAVTGIVGIRLHTLSKTHHIGKDCAMPKHFFINGPDEVICEMEVRLCDSMYPPSITVRTSWNRQCTFGSVQDPAAHYRKRSFQPPAGHFIYGFYFRMGAMRIESFGPIYAIGSHGTPCPSIPPVLRMPNIELAYEQESAHIFESCARLSNVRTIWVYSDADRCIGLQMFYWSSSPEILGWIQETHSYELALEPGDTIRKIWIQERDEQLKQIGFETSNKPCTEVGGKLIDVGKDAVIAWWYSKTKDIIRVF